MSLVLPETKDRAARRMKKAHRCSSHPQRWRNLSTEEAAALSRDAQSIIVSLQFKDITKQHIESVIDRLRQTQPEPEIVRTRLQGTSTADGAAQPTACKMPGRDAAAPGGGEILWPRNS